MDLTEFPQSKTEITHDRYGRYSNLPALPGMGSRMGPVTRVSTLAKTLEDMYNLNQWQMRQIIAGLAVAPELLSVVSDGTDFATAAGKSAADTVITAAQKRVGSHKGADAGTAFHSLTEAFDADPRFDSEVFNDLSPASAAMLTAYASGLDAAGVRPIPELKERVVYNAVYDVAGRFDMIAEDNGQMRICDVKTQKSMTFGHMALCIQLACYATATHMLNETTWEWEPMPRVSHEIGAVLWVPATQPGVFEIHDVDLSAGQMFAAAAVKVRNWRKAKGLVSERLP